MNVFFLLDRSGSMASLWNEAIGSINGYVSKLPAKTKVTLVAFDSVSYDVVRRSTVRKWINVEELEIIPRASTPLYDSCGKIMTEAEEINDEKTILVVMTDGYENASQEYNQTAIKARVDAWEKRGWEVVFLGANFDAVETVSGSVGVMSSKTLNYTRGNFAKGMDILATSTMAYCDGGTAVNFTQADKMSVGESQ